MDECTKAERELIEACACLEVDAAPTNAERLRYRAAHQAVRAERQPEDATEVFIEEVRAIANRHRNAGTASAKACIAAVTKLDAARKEKP